MKKLKVLAAALMAGIFPAHAQAQTALKSLTVEDLVSWQRITQQAISDNGEWVACKMEPWKGDATVYLYGNRGQETARFETAGGFGFSSTSAYLIVSQKPETATVEALKQKKTKKNRMPMDALIIRNLKGGEEKIDSIRSYRLAPEGEWLAYQSGRKDSTLYLRSLDGNILMEYESVIQYGFAPESSRIYYVKDLKNGKKLYVLDPETSKPLLVKEGAGNFSKMTFSKSGDKLAFFYSSDKKTAYKNMEIWLSENQKVAKKIAGPDSHFLPEGWVISQHGSLSFSGTGARLFFGTAPEPRQKDTTQLAENRPDVQVWSWDEPVQHTVQNLTKNSDLKKNYKAMYRLSDGKLIQLATENMPNVSLAKDGDGTYGLGTNSKPYSVSSMWEGGSRSDIYLIHVDSGIASPLSTADYNYYRLSPDGNYAYWYADRDSSWFTLSLADGVKHQLTTPESFPAWNIDNDVPDYPGAYGVAGWSAGDQDLYIYDRYDIWKFDPKGVRKPVRMTLNGREKKITYRIMSIDPEARYLSAKETLYLKGRNEVTKGDGYYSVRLKKPAAPVQLMAGKYMLSAITKAKHGDRVIFTKETYENYPDIHYTDMKFGRALRLTDGGKQQEGFRWGTAELVSWTSRDGKKLEGVVYKPADFDPNKKYPMIVSFYERNSSTLYKYRMPEAHRSTIDYRLYNSHGYVVFNPDIRYRDGHPGESCYDCLIPGVEHVIAEGYIDEKAIAAQGHSWGGYQVAYLATRTDLFAAIESGAPVVNMFSAYGGIRWGSGMARAFQYEHGQSRLATDPWSGPEIYKENSPLFTMDQVTTPILIMHNDQDGHVPWYQGIEYFVAMKRLRKPCWMLNYTGEPHWPTRLANKIDFQKRMMQFFDHFLKGEPMPRWMSEGRPAVDEDFDLGY